MVSIHSRGVYSELIEELGLLNQQVNLKMIKGFLNLPYFTWTAIAIVIVAIFVYIWPRKAVTVTTGFRYFVIRWGHALTWVLLAISFFLRGIGPDLNGGSSFFALAGGLVYLLFMVMTFMTNKNHSQ